MPYTVVIRLNETGEERQIVQEDEWNEVTDFTWSEGSFGCDCNRALFFYNWGPESDDRECSHTLFDIPRIIMADGTVMPFEEGE